MKIDSRKKLHSILKYEKKLNFKGFKYNIMCHESYYILKFLRRLRVSEYREFEYRKRPSIYNTFCFILSERRKNRLGNKLGIIIPNGVFESGLIIFHIGNIIINGNAKIGHNCKLHGNNCIGNNGSSLEAPSIGDNCDIGFGASILGPVKLGNKILIGAGFVVVHSISESSCTLVGIPAYPILKHKRTP